MNSQNLWSGGSSSPKTVLIFPKNFLDFRFDTVEKESIINLNSYRSKSYATVVLNDSEINFFEEEANVAFWQFLFCF